MRNELDWPTSWVVYLVIVIGYSVPNYNGNHGHWNYWKKVKVMIIFDRVDVVEKMRPLVADGDGEDETTRRGPEIFGFRTPARSARTPMKTPLKTPSRTPLKTPTSVSRNGGGGGGGAATPLTGRHAASRAVPRTPQTVRRKLGKRERFYSLVFLSLTLARFPSFHRFTSAVDWFDYYCH